jgi:pilus assembly protein Flp/PilA
MLKRFVKDSRGATAIEYGLIVALICLAIVSGITSMTSATGFIFGNNAERFNDALNGK